MIDKREEKVSLLRLLYDRITPLKYPYSSEEKSIIRRILSEEEWYLLSDDEKQSKRKACISLGEKWALHPLLHLDGNFDKVPDYSYDEGVVAIYEVIREVLKKIDTIDDSSNTDLLRIKVIFQMEKDFIDENLRANKHLPPEFFENFANTLSEKYPELQLDKFYVLYSGMYAQWPNKPKPIT